MTVSDTPDGCARGDATCDLESRVLAGRRRDLIAALLPAEVACVEVRGDDPSAYLFPEEAAELSAAVASRMREFTTARTCARRALQKLGLPATPLLRGPQREPLWPDGVVGSITHCRGYRAAAVAKRLNVLTVGIDAEIHEQLPDGILEQVSVTEERAWLADAPAGVHWDRMLFSAKESVYKAWFPLTGRWLGFEDAAVTFDPAAGTFHARLLVAAPALADGVLTGFSGRFVVQDGLLVTAIALPRGRDRRGELPSTAL